MSEVAERVREAIPGLTNLETGYSLSFAVDYYRREHGFHVLAVLSELLAECDALERKLALCKQDEYDAVQGESAIREAAQLARAQTTLAGATSILSEALD